jgi:hypothetical protein
MKANLIRQCGWCLRRLDDGVPVPFLPAAGESVTTTICDDCQPLALKQFQFVPIRDLVGGDVRGLWADVRHVYAEERQPQPGHIPMWRQLKEVTINNLLCTDCRGQGYRSTTRNERRAICSTCKGRKRVAWIHWRWRVGYAVPNADGREHKDCGFAGIRIADAGRTPILKIEIHKQREDE